MPKLLPELIFRLYILQQQRESWTIDSGIFDSYFSSRKDEEEIGQK